MFTSPPPPPSPPILPQNRTRAGSVNQKTKRCVGIFADGFAVLVLGPVLDSSSSLESSSSFESSNLLPHYSSSSSSCSSDSFCSSLRHLGLGRSSNFESSSLYSTSPYPPPPPPSPPSVLTWCLKMVS